MTCSIDRRRALSFLLAAPFGLFLVRCSSSDTNAASNQPAAPPINNGLQTIYTTNVMSGHSHTFALDDAALGSPPAAGVAGQTSIASDHSHTVTIAMSDLVSAAGGQTVLVTTGVTGGHAHVLSIVKIA